MELSRLEKTLIKLMKGGDDTQEFVTPKEKSIDKARAGGIPPSLQGQNIEPRSGPINPVTAEQSARAERNKTGGPGGLPALGWDVETASRPRDTRTVIENPKPGQMVSTASGMNIETPQPGPGPEPVQRTDAQRASRGRYAGRFSRPLSSSIEQSLLKLMKGGDEQELNPMEDPPKENEESQAKVADGDSKRPKSEVGTNEKLFA
jgi:hypothetical protein